MPSARKQGTSGTPRCFEVWLCLCYGSFEPLEKVPVVHGLAAVSRDLHLASCKGQSSPLRPFSRGNVGSLGPVGSKGAGKRLLPEASETG